MFVEASAVTTALVQTKELLKVLLESRDDKISQQKLEPLAKKIAELENEILKMENQMLRVQHENELLKRQEDRTSRFEPHYFPSGVLVYVLKDQPADAEVTTYFCANCLDNENKISQLQADRSLGYLSKLYCQNCKAYLDIERRRRS